MSDESKPSDSSCAEVRLTEAGAERFLSALENPRQPSQEAIRRMARVRQAPSLALKESTDFTCTGCNAKFPEGTDHKCARGTNCWERMWIDAWWDRTVEELMRG